MRIVWGYESGLRVLRRSPGMDTTLPEGPRQRLAELFGSDVSAGEAVARILADVRLKGDAAALDYTRLLDQVDLQAVEVPRESWAGARESLPDHLVAALETAAGRIRAYHRRALPDEWFDEAEGYGERVLPLGRVGLYVPGGLASYPSTVLMTAIPAKVAGVAEVLLCTPNPTAEVLAAAQVAGVDRLFRLGGAVAIGAMAYGTESVPRVDKVCGPGNVFVALAKQQVYGAVEIDGLYGPTETVLVADDSADAGLCAADLLAQAEHDPMASPILLTPDAGLAERVVAEVDRQLGMLERPDVARVALRDQGVVVVVESVEQAVSLADAFAPEHLCLLVRDPWLHASGVRYAGGLFLGEDSPEVVGDYVAGPSHAMPTGGSARFASYLGVHHFLRHMPILALTPERMREVGPAAVALGYAEGLDAHARAMELRLEGETSRG